MFNLFDMLLLILFAAVCAWLWRGHGIRERALHFARQHCAKLDIELLDGNVALRRLQWQRDSHGHKRLARLYDFEFTVTGDQRLRGSVRMFGQHLGGVSLEAHPFHASHEDEGNVVRLAQWRRDHPRPPVQRHLE